MSLRAKVEGTSSRGPDSVPNTTTVRLIDNQCNWDSATMHSWNTLQFVVRSECTSHPRPLRGSSGFQKASFYRNDCYWPVPPRRMHQGPPDTLSLEKQLLRPSIHMQREVPGRLVCRQLLPGKKCKAIHSTLDTLLPRIPKPLLLPRLGGVLGTVGVLAGIRVALAGLFWFCTAAGRGVATLAAFFISGP